MGSLFFIYTLMNGISIKNWREEDRPREKMLARGSGALTDAELLAILLRTGSCAKSALDIARELLQGAGNSLCNLANYSLDRLTATAGVGDAKAVTLLAAFEAGRRSLIAGKDRDRIVYDARSALEVISPLIAHLDHEECWVLFLNRTNRIISKERMSSGGTFSTTFDVKIVIKRAVEKLASGIILIHNHPSGNPKPGKMDLVHTEELRKAASVLGITLIDHIIVGGDKFYSFCEEVYGRR